MPRAVRYVLIGALAVLLTPLALVSVLMSPVVGLVLVAYGIQTFGLKTYVITSSAMEPTLHCARPAPGCEGEQADRVLVNRFVFRFRDPKRGDVIVFDTPPAAETACGAGGTFVKRIVGLPGERISIGLSGGAAHVFVNGDRLEEPYVESVRRDSGPEKSYRVPERHYFVMGDNRSQSCDSRVWGSLPEENVIGRAFFTYWPAGRLSDRYSDPADT